MVHYIIIDVLKKYSNDFRFTVLKKNNEVVVYWK